MAKGWKSVATNYFKDERTAEEKRRQEKTVNRMLRNVKSKSVYNLRKEGEEAFLAKESKKQKK